MTADFTGKRVRVERLLYDTDSALHPAAVVLGDLPAGRQEHDRDRRRAFVGTQSRHHRRAIQVGHDDVEENEIRPPRDRRRQRFRAGGAIAHGEPQRGFHRLPCIGFAIDQENVKINHRGEQPASPLRVIGPVARHRSLKSTTTMAWVKILAGTFPHAADFVAGVPLPLTAITSPEPRRGRSRISSIEAISMRLRPESLARYSAWSACASSAERSSTAS